MELRRGTAPQSESCLISWFGKERPVLFLLVASLSIVLLSACHQPQASPSHPPATYNEDVGTVFIPNATIITGGVEYTESAPLPDTGLALVVTEDSSLYFYSARLGDLDSITLEHSCKAIGHFLLANLGETGLSPTDVDVELASGIRLRTVSGGGVECTNLLHRWAVTAVSPSGERVLLTPRRLFKLDLTSIFGDWDVFKINRVSVDTVGSGASYATYGGIAKAFLGGSSVPALTLGLAIQEGYNSDPTVFSLLQVLDGLDVIWLVVDAVWPSAGGKLGEVIAGYAFKTAVKPAVEMTMAEVVAAGGAEKVFRDAQRKLPNTIISELLKALTSAQNADRDSLRTATIPSDGTQMPEPVTVAAILKTIQIILSAVDFGWGVLDEVSHDAYAVHIDSAWRPDYPSRVVATVPVGTSPNGVASLPNGSRVYVANEGSNDVSVIQTSGNAVIATVPVGSQPTLGASLPNGQYVYVPCYADNNVSVIRTSDDTVIATIPVGASPCGVAALPSGDYVYVSNCVADNVSVVQTASNTEVATLPVGDHPYAVATSFAGDYVYVTNRGDDNVSKIRTSDNTVVATIPVGDSPWDMAVLPSDSYVYVTNWSSNDVSVIRTSDNTVVATVTVGNQPRGIAALPDGKYVYVANCGSGSVSVIRTSNNTVVAALPVGTEPYGVVALPNGQYVYVANHSGSVSVIGF